MTTKLSYELDWLSFTDAGIYGITDVMNEIWAVPEGDNIAPMRGYNRALKLRAGRVDWHTDRASQRRLWTLTGSDLDKLEKLDFSHAQLLTDVSRTLGANVTRLDFAADIKDAGAKPDDIERAWLAGEVKTNARRMQVIEARDRKGHGKGKTVYIGSRTSSVFLRVYDKGAESKSGDDWLRVEVEAKSPISNKVCAAMAERGIARVGCALARGFVDVPLCEWWADLFSGAGDFDRTIGRKETDWETWVKAVALPNVIRAIDEDTPGVREAIRAALDKFDKSCT